MIKDMHDIIRTQLLTDKLINDVVTEKRIKYYLWPENTRVDGPLILIIPLGTPLPITFGSNEELSMRMTYQIDVQDTNRRQTKEIANQIRQIMIQLGFRQLPETLDTYLEIGRYVDSRRYRIHTTLYDTNY